MIVEIHFDTNCPAWERVYSKPWKRFALRWLPRRFHRLVQPDDHQPVLLGHSFEGHHVLVANPVHKNMMTADFVRHVTEKVIPMAVPEGRSFSSSMDLH